MVAMHAVEMSVLAKNDQLVCHFSNTNLLVARRRFFSESYLFKLPRTFCLGIFLVNLKVSILYFTYFLQSGLGEIAIITKAIFGVYKNHTDHYNWLFVFVLSLKLCRGRVYRDV